jgi:penicillin amidase
MEVLDMFRLATAPVSFEPARLDEAWTWIKVADAGGDERATAQEGSSEGTNNRVVHGSRTATRRPILANDPHRSHMLPSLRYLVHLTMPASMRSARASRRFQVYHSAITGLSRSG